MKKEVNPRASYKKNTMQFIAELSHTVGIEKKFIDMTRDMFFATSTIAVSPKMKTDCINI